MRRLLLLLFLLLSGTAYAQTPHYEGKPAATPAEACANLQQILASLKGYGPRTSDRLAPEQIAQFHQPSYTALNAAQRLKQSADALVAAAEAFHEATEQADPARFTAAVVQLRRAAMETLRPCRPPHYQRPGCPGCPQSPLPPS
ncbi:MAG: hypothetical protein N2557_04575 [Hydrogenophilus sp.]|nr:hypothetical protein [Hydrogenophilus sp.]